MVRSPRATLRSAVANPRSLAPGLLIVAVSAGCSAGFLMTRVGQLAALDQQVRQLESFGAVIGDDTYEQLRRVVPYRPVIDGAFIVIGWPILWVAGAWTLHALCDRAMGLPGRSVDSGAGREVDLSAEARTKADLAALRTDGRKCFRSSCTHRRSWLCARPSPRR